MRRFFLLLLLLLLPLPLITAQEVTPEVTPTPPGVVQIQVWWPDALYNLENEAATATLEAQIEGFNASNRQYEVELRLKPTRGVGSILNTMQAAAPVAPEAMPHLVMMQRADLEAAAQSALIKTVDAWVPDSIREELLPTTLRLGESNGVLYGLPYSLTLYHALYPQEAFSNPPETFAEVLAGETRFLLPGLPRSDQQVNDVVLAQYIRAGGNLADIEGNPMLVGEALESVLSYYADGVNSDIFSAELITFDSESDYWGRVLQDQKTLVMVSSTSYLQNLSALDDLAPMPLPGPEEERPITLLNGWMWVLVTASPDHQNGALAFLEWMMRPDQQAQYTEQLGVIPSQRNALRIWENERYAQQIFSWVEDSLIIPTERQNNAAAMQLQVAFSAVLNGASAVEASNNAISSLEP